MRSSYYYINSQAQTLSFLHWLLFAGILFSPFLDGGIKISGSRVIVFHLYFVAVALLAQFKLAKHNVMVSHPNRVRFWLVLWVGSWLFSILVSAYKNIALLELIRNFELLLFGIIIAKSVRTTKEFKFLLTAFIGAAIWVSLIGWIQSLWGNEAFMFRQSLQVNSRAGTFEGEYIGDRVVTAFGDPITSGHFLCTALGAVFAWALTVSNRRTRKKLLCVAAIVTLPLLTSGSRGPILAGFFTTAILLYLRFHSGKNKAFYFIVLAMLFFCTILLATPDNVSSFESGSAGGVFSVLLLRLAQSFASTTFTRAGYWIYIIEMAIHNPLGVGLANFRFIAPQYIPSYLIYIDYGTYSVPNIHAESLYFNQLAEVGFWGLIAFIGLIKTVLFQAHSNIFTSFWNESGAGANLSFVVFGAWLASSISFITSYAYSNNGIAVIFWFLIGLSMALPRLINAGVLINNERFRIEA